MSREIRLTSEETVLLSKAKTHSYTALQINIFEILEAFLFFSICYDIQHQKSWLFQMLV